ncbi:MAG: sigma-70 family RNA polymerase sigma factor [Terriglobales bacterium]|jgi:RNA polymerase sigma factor (sigma-70 family)
MTGTATRRAPERPDDSSDERLIGRCLNGDQESWSALIDKYKNLIYSIPIKLGMHQDAADIFQSVCVDLLSELPNLREHRALPKWLMQTCYHKCLRCQRAAERMVALAPESSDPEVMLPAASDDDLPEYILVQLEQEQILRDAISGLPKKCEQMVRLLFFEIPPRPYEDIAEQLGMATGSIGAIRGRCLAQLKKQLEKRGF